jgi:hypothetical protein
LKGMQKKTDTWISSLEAKQSEEGQAADRAALVAHREAVATNRLASTTDKRASMERKVNNLVDERFESFQAAVESDKLVANMRIDMERKQRRMKEEEAKRLQRMESKSTPAEDLTSPRNTSRPLHIDSGASQPHGPIVPFTPQSKATNSTGALLSPTSAMSSSSVISTTGVNFSSPSPAGRMRGSGFATTPSNLSTPFRGGGALDQSMDFDDHGALTMALQHASSSNLNTPVGSAGGLGKIVEGGSGSGSGSTRAHRSPSRSRDSEDEDAASRKATAELNALRRAEDGGAQRSMVANRSHSTLPALPNSGLPAAPTSLKSGMSSAASSPAFAASTATTSTEVQAASRRSDLAALQEELVGASSSDAEARVVVLESRAAELPEGHSKQVLLGQARICAQVAEVKRLEEATARRKEELFREQDEMKTFILNAKETRNSILQQQMKRKTREAEAQPPTLPRQSSRPNAATTMTAVPIAASS